MDIEQRVTEIERAAREIAAAEAAAAERRQRLHHMALQALVSTKEEDDLRRLVARLYWDVPTLTVRTIAAAVGTARDVRALAGAGPAIPPCADCGEERWAASRTQLSDPPVRCGLCEQQERRRQMAEIRQREHDERLRHHQEQERQEWLEHVWWEHPEAVVSDQSQAAPRPWSCECLVPPADGR